MDEEAIYNTECKMGSEMKLTLDIRSLSNNTHGLIMIRMRSRNLFTHVHTPPLVALLAHRIVQHCITRRLLHVCALISPYVKYILLLS